MLSGLLVGLPGRRSAAEPSSWCLWSWRTHPLPCWPSTQRRASWRPCCSETSNKPWPRHRFPPLLPPLVKVKGNNSFLRFPRFHFCDVGQFSEYQQTWHFYLNTLSDTLEHSCSFSYFYFRGVKQSSVTGMTLWKSWIKLCSPLKQSEGIIQVAIYLKMLP